MRTTLRDITKGWSNLIISYLKKEGQELSEKAEKKLSVCETCSSRKDSNCTICGCFLPAKVRSDSECPKKLF